MVWSKINFDGALNSENNRGGIGVIIRNENGEAMGAKVSNFINAENYFSVEPNAMVCAMIFAWELGFTKIEN